MRVSSTIDRLKHRNLLCRCYNTLFIQFGSNYHRSFLVLCNPKAYNVFAADHFVKKFRLFNYDFL